MKPLIGISTERSSDPDGERPFKRGYTLELQNSLYPRYIREAGGLPVFLSTGGDREEVRDLLARLDGLLLSGGSDLDPKLWNEDPLQPGGDVELLGEDHAVRSRWEDWLVKEACALDMPLLGICRGMQQLNVSLGGSLWQDLGRQLEIEGHYNVDEPMRLAHKVLLKDAAAHRLFGADSFAVTSTHHQALNRLGQGLRVLGVAEGEERLIEAVDHPGSSFLVGVQWHPERMSGETSARLLVEAFIAAVRKAGRSR